ncbi:MAG: metal ABC transporter ATP-binding protein [Chlamydia sp.]
MPCSEVKPNCPDLISVRGLSVHYELSPVLWDLSFDLPAGSLVGVMGPNGAGKSTLIKAILGLVSSTGSISILGHRKLQSIQDQIAYVPQTEQVDWDFPITVRGLIEMGVYPKRGLFQSLKKRDYEAIDEAIDLLGLQGFENRQIRELSGGQQQRAFLARAIVQKATVYFLDEPFAGVDMTSEKIIIEILKKLEREGKTIVVIHHDLSVCRDYFSWLVLLNTRLVACGPVSDVLTPENLRLTYGRSWQLAEDAMHESIKRRQGG